MFAIKIFNPREKRSSKFDATINTITNHIFQKLRFNKPKIISDHHCIEIISGSENIQGGDITVELVIKKYITIKEEDLEDKLKLDQHINKIKHFCEQAKNIEDLKYLPINMR